METEVTYPEVEDARYMCDAAETVCIEDPMVDPNEYCDGCYRSWRKSRDTKAKNTGETPRGDEDA
jgi:hypothetical protein